MSTSPLLGDLSKSIVGIANVGLSVQVQRKLNLQNTSAENNSRNAQKKITTHSSIVSMPENKNVLLLHYICVL